MKYLFDSDTCVDILRNNQRTIGRLKKVSPADVAISAMTEADLRYGCLLSQRPEVNLNLLESFLALIQIIPFESKAADMYAYLRGKLMKQPISESDLINASIARSLELVVVTSNVREYKRVPDLVWEDWRMEKITGEE